MFYSFYKDDEIRFDFCRFIIRFSLDLPGDFLLICSADFSSSAGRVSLDQRASSTCETQKAQAEGLSDYLLSYSSSTSSSTR